VTGIVIRGFSSAENVSLMTAKPWLFEILNLRVKDGLYSLPPWERVVSSVRNRVRV
jgi:hypothetical protein